MCDECRHFIRALSPSTVPSSAKIVSPVSGAAVKMCYGINALTSVVILLAGIRPFSGKHIDSRGITAVNFLSLVAPQAQVVSVVLSWLLHLSWLLDYKFL